MTDRTPPTEADVVYAMCRVTNFLTVRAKLSGADPDVIMTVGSRVGAFDLTVSDLQTLVDAADHARRDCLEWR